MFGGMEVLDALRLRASGGRRRNLKKLLPGRCRQSDPEGRQAPLVSPAIRRHVVSHGCVSHDVCERGECFELDCSTICYWSRSSDGSDIYARIRALASKRSWLEYRRLRFLLGKDGLSLNQKRFRRLYREEGLVARTLVGRRRDLSMLASIAMLSRVNKSGR